MQQILRFVIKNLRNRKLRSWLTIIGVIIGVIAIVSLMSLSQGLKTTMNTQFNKLGANKISITSKYNQFGAKTNTGLTTDDIRTINQISDVDYVVGEITSVSSAEFANKTIYMHLVGWDVDNLNKFFIQNNIELLKGSLINNPKDKQIIVGYNYYNDFKDLFGKKLNIGNKVKINNELYTVVGILKDTGDNTKNVINYISITNMRKITNTPDTTVDKIYVVTKNGTNIENVAQRIENKLKIKRGVDDFIVTTPTNSAKNKKEMLDIITIVVLGIAAISLLVGGVGIMNSTFTSVTERRRDIGILKAIGAKRKDILLMFLLESGMIGIVGGIIGAIIGFLLAFAVKFIALQAGTSITVVISLKIILIALIFSFVMGIISGLIPAYRASKQQAVNSLREE